MKDTAAGCLIQPEDSEVVPVAAVLCSTHCIQCCTGAWRFDHQTFIVCTYDTVPYGVTTRVLVEAIYHTVQYCMTSHGAFLLRV